MKRWVAAGVLVIIGSVQMLGDILGVPALRAVGAATHASPAPKVFTAQNGYETFSSRFFIDWTDDRGERRTIGLDPRTYRGMRGPYNRRNAYGAALSYAPVLVANARTRAMFDAVLHYAFCGEAPLLEEVGIAREKVVYPLLLRLEPREARIPATQWQTVFEVSCAPIVAMDGVSNE